MRCKQLRTWAVILIRISRLKFSLHFVGNVKLPEKANVWFDGKMDNDT